MMGVIGHLSRVKPVPGKAQVMLCGKIKTYRKWKRYIPMSGACMDCVEVIVGGPVLREGKDE